MELTDFITWQEAQDKFEIVEEEEGVWDLVAGSIMN